VLNAARIVLRFRHHGIARLFDIGRSGEFDYLVQEYIPGGNLAELIQDQRERSLLPPSTRQSRSLPGSAGRWTTFTSAV